MKGIEQQNAESGLRRPESKRFVAKRRSTMVCMAVSCLAALSFLALLAAPTWAEGEDDPQGRLYPPSSLDEASRDPDNFIDQLIDSKAAKDLPRVDLGRDEAKELAESVFGGLLESSAGPFGDLNVEEFVSDTAAIVAPSESQTGVIIGGEKAAEEEDQHVDGPLLLESTVPLRTETDTGQEQVVDLDLEHDEGELQPVNPLVEVGIPSELGEGIELSSASLELDASPAAEERTASILAGNVAFYPNVAKDTDFAIASTPTGVETFTQLRSADAPQTQTLRLNLNGGATLAKSPGGGAVATSNDQEVLRVMPPTAVDANGNSVPTTLEVSGDSIVLTTSTDETTAFPVLLDPTVYDMWTWNGKNTNLGLDKGDGAGSGLWRSARNTAAYGAQPRQPWVNPPEPLLKYLTPGLNLTSGWPASVEFGAQANWNYYVPRYFTDYEKFGTRPTSFIQTAQMWNLQYVVFSSQGSPWMVAGIWDENLGKWVSSYTRNGYEGTIGEKYWYYLYEFTNPTPVQSAKNVGLSLISTEPGANNGRIVYVGSAMVAMNDLTKPAISSFAGPTKWENATAVEGVKIDATDSGLGMKYLRFEGEKAGETSLIELYCAGTGENPCPRTWNDSIWKGYPAASLSTGIHLYTATAFDVLGNESAEHPKVPVKIDHTAPGLTVSGTMTQQASLGYKLPQYVLHLEGTDGVSGAPQAGIASSEVTVDGKVVDSTKAGCATQNCSLSRDWTLKSESFTPGEHKVVASVTDGAGNTTTKSLTIKIEKDTTAPNLETGGTLVTAPEGWVEQVSRTATAYAEDLKGYGVTSLTFSIDGKVIKSVTGTCEAGSCERSLWASVDMATYTGGAHSAELIAKDGAGNVSKDAWAINVNPKGTVPSAEAVDTIEAAEETTDSTALAPTSEVIDPAEIEDGNNPALVVEESALISTGTGADSSMTTDAGEGFTIDTGSETFHIEPVASTGTETNLAVTNGIAGVAANTTVGVDSVIRPIYDGIQAFQDIRLATAPETYSWKVQLHPGQSLKTIDETHVGIYYEELELLAMTITAEIAHDATGKEVPTSLSVSEGKILTLNVKHKGKGFVYPIGAGPAWQTGYETIIVHGPPTKQEQEAEEARELAEQHAKECAEGKAGCAFYAPVSYERIGPPIVLPFTNQDDGGASASAARPHYKRHWEFELCTYDGPFGCEPWDLELEGTYEFNHKFAWWKKDKPHPKCPYSAHGASVTLDFCDWAGPNHQPDKAGGYHISAQGLYHVAPGGGPVEKPEPITEYMYASGIPKGHRTASLCNPTVSC